jgi:hypothetical protein
MEGGSHALCLTTYDAAYLDLVSQERLTIVTFDKAMREVATSLYSWLNLYIRFASSS